MSNRIQGVDVKRDMLKFLCGAAAAATYVHVAYALWTHRGKISVPVWKGREWGPGKMLAEAVVYAAMTAGFGYLAWRPQSRHQLETG